MNRKSLRAMFIFLVLSLLASCLPEQTPIRNLEQDVAGEVVDSTAPGEITSGISEQNFIQQGSTTTYSTLNLFSDFQDSFIMRGDNVHNFLKDHIVGTSTRLCMALNFPQAIGTNSKKVLILAARVRSYFNNNLNGKEYYIQMQPSNYTANVGDCTSVNLTNTLQSTFGSNTFAFKISDVCPDCNSNIASSIMNFYSSDGSEVLDITKGSLGINLMPEVGTTPPSGLSCSNDSTCKIEGFNCCLQGQCVNHGETRPSVDTSSSSYLSAIEQLTTRPELISNYSEYFYVCPELVGTPPSTGTEDPVDPDQQSQDLLTELDDLYNCINPKFDEISVCSAFIEIDSSKIGSGGTTISAGADDITFSSVTPTVNANNIVQIDYAGVTIFKEKILSTDTEISLPTSATLSPVNDDLFNAQTATVDMAIPADAVNSLLKIGFKVDGTCERLGQGLARCQKQYVQGQVSTPARSSDHIASSSNFKIPAYANLNYNVIVEVNDAQIPPGVDTWTVNTSSYEVQFSGMSVYQNQKVNITYFVTNNVNALLASKEAAQEQVNMHCKCDPDVGCNLTPIYETQNDEQKLVAYECFYPQPDTPEAPLQKTVYLSSKTVPHRYYDSSGVHYELPEIGSAQDQEGNEFKYYQQNTLKPNNQDNYVGFNEIYGSFKRDEISAMPATVVDIKKGKTYDLFTDSGIFSTCLDCGNDYFSNLKKLFPGSFLHMGGGYLPDMVESRTKTNQGEFSSVDLKYGRACFVPATMIPWTHKENTDVTQQRRDRLKAQHFLFANGYNKDWFGFDYGSLIGSFDGVKWFSIGNERRIQAKSNKLYIAINAYFGDMTIDNSFQVTINETLSDLNSGASVTHDTESDGAQCQKAHYCSTDNDCIAQLGYEYACQSVSGIRTPWPVFDSNGNEMAGSSDLSLLSIIGGSNGQVKRCVYRGAGAACNTQLSAVTDASSYNSDGRAELHSCSSNTYCADLSQAKFNDRISRYGRSPATQNNYSFITDALGLGDTFGLGARLIGRPLDFYGNSLPPSGVRSHLESLKVNGLCVPGKDPQGAQNLGDLNSILGTRLADKALGIGRTYPDDVLQDPAYYAACPAVDSDGNFTHTNNLSENLSSHSIGSHTVNASSQNLSTNALDVPSFNSLDLFNDDSQTMGQIGVQKAACLRAPGASCFTDMDCSPSSFIGQKVRSIASFGMDLSKAEQNFWKEELVCANSQQRYPTGSIYPNPSYELIEHKCCRELGKDFTFSSQRHMESDFEVVQGDDPSGAIVLPGVNQDINSPKRYSRTHTVYDKLINERSSHAPLYAPGKTRTNIVNYDSISELLQYNTLHVNNSRMCCTGHWVRNFAGGSEDSNGGHKFSGTTQQNIPKETFRTIAWLGNKEVPGPDNDFENYDPAALRFYCNGQDYATSDCEIKHIPEASAEETKFLNWFAKFELVGIPQVLIETNDEIFRDVADPLTITRDTEDSNNLVTDDDGEVIHQQSPIASLKRPVPNTIKDVFSADPKYQGIPDAQVGGKQYYSAASYDNLEIDNGPLKKVFSEDSFACCMPTGVEVDGSTPNNQCCTGQVNTDDNGVSRCCLNDFSDVSVYTNRYVSSEGATLNGNPISDSDIDKLTGYIRKEVVLEMASNMCCSGKAAYGVAIGNYYIPMEGGGKIENAKTRRWLYKEDLDNATGVGGAATYFDAGMKWNNHVYCIPADMDVGDGTGGGGGSGTIQN